jgi:hypothetical protein
MCGVAYVEGVCAQRTSTVSVEVVLMEEWGLTH